MTKQIQHDFLCFVQSKRKWHCSLPWMLLGWASESTPRNNLSCSLMTRGAYHWKQKSWEVFSLEFWTINSTLGVISVCMGFILSLFCILTLLQLKNKRKPKPKSLLSVLCQNWSHQPTRVFTCLTLQLPCVHNIFKKLVWYVYIVLI